MHPSDTHADTRKGLSTRHAERLALPPPKRLRPEPRRGERPRAPVLLHMSKSEARARPPFVGDGVSGGAACGVDVPVEREQ